MALGTRGWSELSIDLRPKHTIDMFMIGSAVIEFLSSYDQSISRWAPAIAILSPVVLSIGDTSLEFTLDNDIDRIHDRMLTKQMEFSRSVVD